MLFHTWEFAIFFAIVYTVYLALRRTRYWTAWLFLSSYVFYGWWNPVYLLLIIASTMTDYFMVRFITKPRERGWAAVSDLPLAIRRQCGGDLSGRPARRPVYHLAQAGPRSGCWRRSCCGRLVPSVVQASLAKRTGAAPTVLDPEPGRQSWGCCSISSTPAFSPRTSTGPRCNWDGTCKAPCSTSCCRWGFRSSSFSR